MPIWLPFSFSKFSCRKPEVIFLMSKRDGVAAPLVVLLVFTPTLVVFGSRAPGDGDHERSGFKRPDPLRGFKYYKGGYDVRDKHYWASAAFTGIHGYVVAGIWMLSGLGFGIFVRLKNPRSDTESEDHLLDRYYVVLFLFVILLTILAIVATGFILAENHNSLKRTRKLKNTIVRAGENVSSTIEKVRDAMTVVESLLLEYDEDTSLRLNITIHKLGNESQNIQNFVQKSGHSIDDAIQASNTSHLVVVNINLIFVAAAIVLLLLHWHPGFVTVILLCWILTTLCWVLTGFDFFLHTFAEDSCSAFEDFVQNPQNNSLSALLPCMSSTRSAEILSRIGHTIHSFIAELNIKLRQIYLAYQLDKQADYPFGSGRICDPFTAGPNYTYIPETCTEDDIQIGDLPNVLSNFTCYGENSTESCRRYGKFIPQKYYDKAWTYSHSVQGMLDIYPDLQSLTKCKTMKSTFSDVVRNQCKSFKFSIRLLWSWMLALSIFMVVLIFAWVARAWQDKGRCFSRWSIVPNPR